MNKYKLLFEKNEHIPKIINDALLSKLLLNYKINLSYYSDFLKFKDLNNTLTLNIMLLTLNKATKEMQDIIRNNYVNKMDKNALYSFFLIKSCDLLSEKNYDLLQDVLESFIVTNLIKDANLENDKKNISLTLLDDSKVKYQNVPLDKKLTSAYNKECHNVTLGFLEKCKIINNAAVVLEKNELYGKYYHSIALTDDAVYDLSHNIVMSYENYIKLINPTVILREDEDTILSNIEALKNKDKVFKDSNYCDLLKYAMEKQKVKKHS